MKKLLADRIPNTLGDQAVLEGETKRLLDLPGAALLRANSDIVRRVERDRGMWAGTGASAMCAIFAAGRASIAHMGDCRTVRVRRGILDVLTKEHSLANDYAAAKPGQPIPEAMPANVVTRALGMSTSTSAEVMTAKLERGDVFMLMSIGIHGTFSNDEIRDAILRYGVEAAPRLVARGQQAFAAHTLENVAAVAVEIL